VVIIDKITVRTKSIPEVELAVTLDTRYDSESTKCSTVDEELITRYENTGIKLKLNTKNNVIERGEFRSRENGYEMDNLRGHREIGFLSEKAV